MLDALMSREEVRTTMASPYRTSIRSEEPPPPRPSSAFATLITILSLAVAAVILFTQIVGREYGGFALLGLLLIALGAYFSGGQPERRSAAKGDSHDRRA
jgi:hypothetical protein